MAANLGPHQGIAAENPREQWTAELFDRLWDVYRERVEYVRTYEQVVKQHGGTFVNDHVAFRTFAAQHPLTGIASVSRIFEAIGYRAAGVYDFADKHLSATHFQHPNPRFPKVFISELRTWELGDEAEIIWKYSHQQRPTLDDRLLRELARLDAQNTHRNQLLDRTIRHFLELPWPVPEKTDVERLNRVSQYAAWVLVHGYNVNHFTSLVNSHGVDTLNDLELTIDAMKQAGVPMKSEIEGERGSRLRQSATEAVVIEVDVMDQGELKRVPWTYAYFEFAQRDTFIDPATGSEARFEGFLGPQATNLFEMTRVRGPKDF